MQILNYEVYRKSDKTPWVVFIHGAGGAIAAWKYQLKPFGEHFNVLAIDLRDHGKSKNLRPENEKYNFRLIADDILAVIQKEGIKKAHFVTLSFGSVLLQDFSMRYPQLIDRVVMAGGIFRGNIWIKSFVHLARVLNLVLTYPQMYRTFSYLLMPRERHQRSRRVYQIQSQKITKQEYLKWVGLYSEFFLLLRKFSHQNIEFKGLVIMGKEDYIFLKAAKEFSKRQRYISIHCLDKAGHICNIDRPEEFNLKAISFLKRDNT